MSVYKDSDALEKLYQHIGVGNETEFRRKLKMLRIPFSYKESKKEKLPPSKYKFRFFAHGGRLAEDVKQTLLERAKSKEEEKDGRKLSKQDSGLLHSSKVRSITEKA